MNNIDKQYQQLLQDIIDNGISKSDRTGTGTISVFGRQIRHKMSEGFPLLTTKKMAFKTMVVELLWFLRGDTNIKFLLDYDCHIWDGDAYKGYEKECVIHKVEPLPKERFIEAIKNGNNKEPHFIPDFTGYKLGDLGKIYGKQWRNWKSVDTSQFWQEDWCSKDIDQIQNLINELKTNPDSRRLMVSAWNVGELERMVLPPCHYGFQVYTRELSGEERWELLEKKVGKETFKSMVDDIVPFGGGLSEELQSNNIPKRGISLMWNQRSCDFPLGIPMNIASYALLLMIIGKEVNMIPDELIGNLGDCHIYLNQIEGVKEQINREPFEHLPSVNITERNWYLHESVKKHLGEKTFIEKIMSYRPDCFELIDYQSHGKIRFPLSN